MTPVVGTVTEGGQPPSDPEFDGPQKSGFPELVGVGVPVGDGVVILQEVLGKGGHLTGLGKGGELLAQGAARGHGLPASRKFTKLVPLTTRPSLMSRQGIIRFASI